MLEKETLYESQVKNQILNILRVPLLRLKNSLKGGRKEANIVECLHCVWKYVPIKITISYIYGDTVVNAFHLFPHLRNPMKCCHKPYFATKETAAQISWPPWSRLRKN